MKTPHEILATAKESLKQAELVRLNTIRAVDLALEAVNLETSGVATELIKVATEKAEKAMTSAATIALIAWESAALVVVERKKLSCK